MSDDPTPDTIIYIGGKPYAFKLANGENLGLGMVIVPVPVGADPEPRNLESTEVNPSSEPATTNRTEIASKLVVDEPRPFKPGDRVRCIDAKSRYGTTLVGGNEYVIEGEWIDCVTVEGIGYPFAPERFVLVEPSGEPQDEPLPPWTCVDENGKRWRMEKLDASPHASGGRWCYLFRAVPLEEQ